MRHNSAFRIISLLFFIHLQLSSVSSSSCWQTSSGITTQGNIDTCYKATGASCTTCHGKCCVDDGSCPNSACPGNDLAPDDSNANCVGGFASGTSSNTWVETVTGGSCPLKDGSSTYYAFCDLSVYGGSTCEGTSWKRSNICASSRSNSCPTNRPSGNHCLVYM